MTPKVLIVDDSEINLVLFDTLIKKLGGCEPVTFLDPLAGLAWAQAHEVHLVIVDYMMPGLDGIEFIQRLRQSPGKQAVPILMITTNEQKKVLYEALDAGATDFLTKPIDRIEFLARVKNMLALSESRRQLADRAAWLADEVRKATAEILERERETVVRLSKAAEYRDPETGAHILRMAHYAALIARGMGLPLADQELLLLAAPLHDVGKVGIPDAILLKPGRLGPDELHIMKKHAEFGHQILDGSLSRVLQAGAVIAWTHHEKFDGSGYPRGLQGLEIPVFSRIVAVADVFDALTSPRPYKSAWALDRAVAHIQAGAGTSFDPDCVAALLSQWDDVLEIRQRFADEQ
jgi:putative two-component system response regulator